MINTNPEPHSGWTDGWGHVTVRMALHNTIKS